MWLVQCDEYNVTNAIWQIQCSERNEINTMRHACDMHGTCMGHECDAHGMCMGRAPAMHSWGVHWGWRTKGDFGDPVSYGCHVLLWVASFGDEICSGWHVLVTRIAPGDAFWWKGLFLGDTFCWQLAQEISSKLKCFGWKNFFRIITISKFSWGDTAMDQFMGSEGSNFL